MILSLLDTKILQLINQYSINGSVIQSTNGTIQDYTLRTRNLIDACQKELANKFTIYKSYSFPQVGADLPSDFASINLPTDLKKILNVKLNAYPAFKDIEYFRQDNTILINPKLTGTIIINYAKLPADITASSDPNTQLEINADAQELIPYYVAGHVYLEDNPTVSTMLLNEYEQKLQKLTAPEVFPQNTVTNGWGW